MKRTILFTLAIASIVVVFLSGVAQSTPDQTKAKVMKAANSAETSYVACYFRKDDGSISWQWGLTGTNAYYSFTGEWKKTAHTKITKFFSSVDYSSLCDACTNAKSYYKESGTVFAMFAATTNAGSNFPIILGGNEISPLF